jgi:outer membrane protein W
MGWTHWEQYQPWVRTPSLYVSFHFPKAAHQKIEPFVQAGATLMYFQTDNGRGSAAANFGGGANLWFTKHVALRCDVKDFQGTNTYPNLLEFRIGLAFR